MGQKAKKGGTRAARYKWIGHMEVYFDDNERAEAIEYLGGYDRSIEDTIDIIVQGQCGVKFSYDDNNDCYRATLQPKDKNCYLYGYTLGVNHIELNRLAGLALYIITVLVENEAIDIPSKSGANDF